MLGGSIGLIHPDADTCWFSARNEGIPPINHPLRFIPNFPGARVILFAYQGRLKPRGGSLPQKEKDPLGLSLSFGSQKVEPETPGHSLLLATSEAQTVGGIWCWQNRSTPMECHETLRGGRDNLAPGS